MEHLCISATSLGSASATQTDFLLHSNCGGTVRICIFFCTDKLTAVILFDGCDNTSGKRLLVMASLCIEIRFMNESEPVILLGKKPSYGNRNPEPVLCCYPSRVDKQ